MEKQGNLKNVVIIILALVIIALVVAIYFLTNSSTLQVSTYAKENPMSKEEVLSLVEKRAEYSNWYMTVETVVEEKMNVEGRKEVPENEDAYRIKTEEYYKDNVLVVKTSQLNKQDNLSWTDYNTGDQINITNEGEKKTIEENKIEEEIRDSRVLLNSNIIEDLKREGNQFEYLGETKYQYRDCIVIKITTKDGEEQLYYIDSEKGILLKHVMNHANAISTILYNMQYDVVTDENIEKPDLADYEGYERIQK